MPLIRGLERQTVEENKNADYMALPEQALVVVLMGVFALETSLRTEIGPSVRASPSKTILQFLVTILQFSVVAVGIFGFSRWGRCIRP